MARTPHLKLRDGVFYWRRRIPSALVERLGCYELSLSLGTRDPLRARQCARRLSTGIEQLLAEPDWMDALSPTDARRHARRWLKRMLDEMEQTLASRPTWSAEVLEARRKAASETRTEFETKLAANDLSMGAALGRSLLAESGVAIANDAVAELGELPHFIHRAAVEYARHAESCLHGNFTLKPSDPAFLDLDPEPAEAKAPPPAPKLSDVVAQHLDSAGRDWTAQTKAQCECTFTLYERWQRAPDGRD